MTDTADGNGKLLARIDERTKHIAQKQEEHHQQLCERLEDHESRLRTLEGQNRQGVFRDVGAVIAAAFMAVVAWLTKQPN